MAIGTDVVYEAVDEQGSKSKGSKIGHCSTIGKPPKKMFCCRNVGKQLKMGMQIFINEHLLQIDEVRKIKGGFSLVLIPIRPV
jgi:hypothetical protein